MPLKLNNVTKSKLKSDKYSKIGSKFDQYSNQDLADIIDETCSESQKRTLMMENKSDLSSRASLRRFEKTTGEVSTLERVQNL